MTTIELAAALKSAPAGPVYLPGGGLVSGVEEHEDHVFLVAHDYAAAQKTDRIQALEAELEALKNPPAGVVQVITPGTGSMGATGAAGTVNG